MKKILITLSALLVFAVNSNAILITGFGTSAESGASAFTIDTGNSDFTTIAQTSTNTNIIGNDGGNIFIGSFSPIDVAGLTVYQLSGTLSGTNPNSNFTVELYNTDFSQFRTYSGNFSSFSIGVPSTALLTFVTQTAAFTDIAAFTFTPGGLGTNPVNLTLDSLAAIAAIPEPTTNALLFFGVIGLVLLARRRQVASQY